jgi:hypothetical protein
VSKIARIISSRNPRATPMPICLSDRQSLTVTSAAAALCPSDRDQFLQTVALHLAGLEIGDGAVHRAVAAAFQLYFKPPEVPHTPSRWTRERPNFAPSKRAY